ncbi:hypothetical protein [Candidatus Ruminimicrobiellum ovillum]|uniref:hypothetical protein n=1 Tax=Candidatus Ruminimicrobiellum ovillum TaxID=1947927 RepID=UPI00355A76A1
MKQILILLSAVIFIFICMEILLQTNYYVLLYFNKIYNKDVSVVQTKYKLKTVETFMNINDYIKNKSITMVK